MGTLTQLNTNTFARLIRDLGEVPLVWYRKVGHCPNPNHMDAVGGMMRTLPTCPLCGGCGEVFKNMPLPMWGVTGGKVACQQAMVGSRRYPFVVQGGEMVCTFLENEYAFHDGDRIALGSRVDVVDLTYERERDDDFDPLMYTPVVDVLTAYRGDTVTETFAFKASEDGLGVTWTGTPPPSGTLITLVYSYKTSWSILGSSFHRRVRATNGDFFPARVLMTKWMQRDTDRAPGFL